MDSLTVYICTYNEEENIQNCISSIVVNGYNNIIVIDASENDLTKEKAEEFGAKVIKTSKGLAGQRQVAIDNCETEYLMFVDADDRLEKDCINKLLYELEENSYDAIQASLRVFNPKSYWQKGMDANLQYCINSTGKTKMIGRPALYKTDVLKKVGMDISFNGVGNEDAALSIKMENYGGIQGKGTGISFRHHPESFKENFIAWKKYGKGDAQLIRKYPNKILNILKHLLFVYPIYRSFKFIQNKKSKYIFYPILIGLVRVVTMFINLVYVKKESR